MINTKTFKHEQSRWQDIYKHLKKEGFDVYSPGTKVGECLKPYVVPKDNGVSKNPNFSTNNHLYSLMCYVPKDNYSYLEIYVEKVKKSMEKLRPMIMYNDTHSPSFLDDEVKAHMVSVEYKNYRTIKEV